MKQFINILLLLVISIPIASCQNKEKMRTKFEWLECTSAPLGYPVDVYRGGLQGMDGSFTSLYSGTTMGEWGEANRGMSNGMKSIPNHLHVIWVSYAENKFYEVDSPIDYDKMLQLFNEGLYTPSIGDDPSPRKENFNKIIVGFAPGGIATVWLNALGSQIEIGSYQGKEVVIPQEVIDELHLPISNLFDPEYRRKIMYEFDIVPLEVVQANEGKPIPYGLWESYRQRYNWKVDIQLPNKEKVKDVDFFFYNGEKYFLFGTTLIEEYPNIIPNKLKFNVRGEKPVPSNINFSWVVGNRYVGKVAFDEKEVFAAFEEVFKDHPDGEATLIITVNEMKTSANVRLVNGDKEVWITSSEITVRKTDWTD